LLLAAVVLPEQPTHGLHALAEKLGVDATDRHHALSDALVTGAIFLKLLPLLEEQGITTLREALEASKKTFYARLAY
jgi:DNA polymerase III subunit epsilon